MKPRLELSTLTVLLLTLGCDAPSTTPVAGGVPDKPTQPDRGEPTAVTIPVENPSASDEAYYTDRLSKWDCMSQATPGFVSQGEHVEIAPGTRTTTSTPLELFWSVCNEGATGSGPSYRLVTELLTIDPNAAVPVTVTPVSELTITTPTIDSCKCYFQVVGVNRDVTAAALSQQFVQGAQFPRVTPDLALRPDQGVVQFTYRFRVEGAPFQQPGDPSYQSPDVPFK